MRSINIANSKGRDAVVGASGVARKTSVRWLDPQGRQVQNVRVLKGTLARSLDRLSAAHGGLPGLADALVQSDPEIDIEMCGTFLRETSRVYIDADGTVVHSIQEWEIVHNPDGTEKERRPREAAPPNTGVEVPLRWSGKLIKRADACRRFVFAAKQQIAHINGLTYDFLYAISKELEEKDSLLIMGAGPKANTPLVFQRGGTPFRGFLEGRTKGDKYCLLLHLSNLELKGTAP